MKMFRICALSAVLTGLALVAGGCAPAHTAPNRRPTAEASVSESLDPATFGPAALSYFDELETRGFVVHDDVLEAALLLGTGQGAPLSPNGPVAVHERIALAEALGYVDLGYSRPPREAATIGETAVVLLRVLRGSDGRVPADQAVRELVGMGALPPTARSAQGLTGAQLISMLGSMNDAMRRAGVSRVTQPAVPRHLVPTPDTGAPSSTVSSDAP
jgi:hypothetical protein